MKITILPAEESTLEEFAEKHQLEMVVKEDPRERPGSARLYHAKLERIFTSRSISYVGFGGTPEEAIKNYASFISGKTLSTDEPESCVFGYTFFKQIKVPRLILK